MLLLNLDVPLCINDAFTDVRSLAQPAGHRCQKTGDMWTRRTTLPQSARGVQMSLSSNVDRVPGCS